MMRWSVMMAVGAAGVLAAAEPAEGLSASGSREADQVAVQALLPQVAAALAGEGGGQLDDLLAPGFRLTAIDQHTVGSVSELRAHLAGLRAAHGIQSIAIAPLCDGPATFTGSDTGFCTGSTVNTFITASDTLVLNARWTATVVRDHGRWKVATLQAGVDPTDNPLINRSRAALRLALPVIGIGFLLVGMAMGFIIARWRRLS